MPDVGSLISESAQRAIFSPTSTEPGTLSENISAGYQSQIDNYNSTSKQQIMARLIGERNRAYEQLTGEPLSPDLDPNYRKPDKVSFFSSLIESDPLRGDAIRDDRVSRELDDNVAAQNNSLKILKTQNPDLFKDIMTDEELEVEAANQARISAQKAAELMAATPGVKAAAGQFIGSMGGTFQDPVNVASLMFGASSGVSIGRAILIEAGINAGTEAITQPFVVDWQDEIGNQYGFKESMANVGMAAVFGGGLTAVFRGTRPAASTVFRKLSDVKIIPKRARTAFKNVADYVQIKERNPYGLAVNIRRDLDHVESIVNVEKRALAGEKIEPEDIKITEEEFLSIRRELDSAKTKIERAQIKEFNDFKKDYKVDVEYPPYQVQTLPPQLLNRFDEQAKVKPAELLPEEQRMMDSAGVKKNKDGSYNRREINKEIKQRKAENKLDTTPKDDRSHIEDFNRQVKRTTKVKEPTPLEDPVIESRLESSLTEPKPLPERVQADQELASSPEAIIAREAEFNRLADEFSDEVISLDDGDFTMRDILERFDQEEQAWEAMRVCGVGR